MNINEIIRGSRPKPRKVNLPDRFWPYTALTTAFLLLIVYFYPHPQASNYKYEEGRPWNYAKLIAPFDLPIHPDSASVSGSLDSLYATFVPVYAQTRVNVDSIMNLTRRRMDSFRMEGDEADNNRVPERLADFYTALSRTLVTAYHRGVLADSLPDALGTTHRAKARVHSGNILESVPTSSFITRRQLLNNIDSLGIEYNVRRRLQNSGIHAMVQPSVVCNVEESERIMANEKAMITIDRGVIQRGQTIIDKGAIVTPQDYTNLRTYEQMLRTQLNDNNRSNLLMFLGQVLYVGLLLFAFMSYLYFYEHELIWRNRRAVIFLLSIITVFFLLSVAVEETWPRGFYIVPLPIVAVLTLAFFNGRTALWTALVCVLLCAGLARFQLEFIVMQFAATAAGVLSVRDLTKRAQLLRATAFVAIAYCLAYTAVELMMNGSFDDFSWSIVAILILNGLLVSLSYVLMWGVERLFGFVSNVTLVELTDSNAPLLRELSDECPGTFQHSVAVSTLAADAARAIDANVLLTRAGAMYHDIGKMDNPIFFTENQHGVNPHDGLSPERSARIIVGHVTDGLRRAEKAGLPVVLRDFITQHHGHGQAKYFYITACNQAADGKVDPEPYTYPGSNPTSRETSVLMMADAVEAASRSLTEHTPDAIRSLVDHIIDDQIKAGLHNSSPLAFRDVERIKRAFVKRLSTIYHSRIAYPTAK